MRILHTSDWHLGKRLENFSRLEEQQAVLSEICEIADFEKVDAVIVAGDLFDTFNPPVEAIDLFYKTLKRLSNNGMRAVIAIAGNHDSPDRIEAPDPLARECGIFFAGYPASVIPVLELESGLKVTQSEPGFVEFELPISGEKLRLLLTPYANEMRLKTYLGSENSEDALRDTLKKFWETLAQKYCDFNGVNVMVAHLLFIKEGDEQPVEPEEEKPILYIGGAQSQFSSDIPKEIQYVALGHLHRKQTIDKQPCPIVYSGSPLAFSFSEANQDKFVMIIDAVSGAKATIKEIKLNQGKRLIRKSFNQIDEAVEWLIENQNILIELTIVSDTYLAGEDRKRLMYAHEGIVALIPEISAKHTDSKKQAYTIDINKNMDELFVDFFKSKKGQEPNKRLLDLFKEVLAVKE
jgi:exonuclease SbcD